MAVSNNMFQDFSFDLSDETRGEEANFHISNQIESLWNTLDPYDSTATTGSETNIYGYNRDSRGEKNEEKDYRNQMIDLPELLVYQDMEANAPRVERAPLSENISNNVESYADSNETRGEDADFQFLNQIVSTWNTLDPYDSIATTGSETNIYGYNRDSRGEKNQEKDYRNQMIDLPELLVYQDMDANAPRVERAPLSEYIDNNVESRADLIAIRNTCAIVKDARKRSKLISPYNRLQYGDLIKRYCSKCKIILVDAAIYQKKLCATCEIPLSYQCARCDNQYCSYRSLFYHIERECNIQNQNLNLKCRLCDYQTHSKMSMSDHLNRCLSGISFRCGFCVYTSKNQDNLRIHMITKHKDILKIDGSQCKTKPHKCKQCKKMVAICRSCHTGLSSTDRFQEHQKSCRQTVLECKFCPFKTYVNMRLKKHLKLKHLSVSISQALPTQN